MCWSGAYLVCGIKVPLIPLAIAATAFFKQRDAFLAIDLILARRRQGILHDAASELGIKSSIADLPEEVWLTVKDELATLLWQEAEDSLKRRPEQRFDFRHVGSACDQCFQAFADKGGMAQFKDMVTSAVMAMLSQFQLTMLGEYCISNEHSAYYDMEAVIPVVLSQYVSTRTEVDHALEPQHSCMSLLPTFFALPPDADSRFERLLRFFPQLNGVQKTYGDCQVVGAAPGPSLQDGGDDPGAEHASDARVKPTWGFWNWTDCC
ncbi:hypothetical protein JCM10450v2_001372 [Rhodotorula kratochvilovae]